MEPKTYLGMARKDASGDGRINPRTAAKRDLEGKNKNKKSKKKINIAKFL